MNAQPADLPTPYERFCSMLASLIANRDGRPSVVLRDRLEREFLRDVPKHTPDEYMRAMALIGRASGLR